MALETRKKRPNMAEEHAQQKVGDLEALAQSIVEHPVMYALAAVFVLACIVAGLMYRAGASGHATQQATDLARAMLAETPGEQVEKLTPVAEGPGEIAARALYQLGEAAYEAGDFAKAEAAFARVIAEHDASPFAADAAEGLGYIAEEKGGFDDALGKYKEVLAKWAGTFAARRQYLNIGRVNERLEKFEDAVTAYRQQMDFFPGSHVAEEAQAALARLEESHPGLFPEPEAEEAPAAGASPGQETEGETLPAPVLTPQAGAGEPVPESNEAAAEQPAPADSSQ